MATKPKVLILGTGPSAAFAVQACKDLGINPYVWGEKPPHFTQAGAFFIHHLPESLQAGAVPMKVRISRRGNADSYSVKQWGRILHTSFPDKEYTADWYSSVELARVWNGVHIDVKKLNDVELLSYGGLFDWIFHTFPLECHSQHRVCGSIPCLVGVPYNDLGPRVLYSGSLKDDWIRLTDSMGRRTLEFPGYSPNSTIRDEVNFSLFRGTVREIRLRDLGPRQQPVPVPEYLSSNIIPVGRWACWDHKMLSHDTYERVRSYLE